MLDHEGYLAWFECAAMRIILLRPNAYSATSGEPRGSTPALRVAAAGRKLCIVDWDGDGKLDILVNAANAAPAACPPAMPLAVPRRGSAFYATLKGTTSVRPRWTSMPTASPISGDARMGISTT